MKHSCLANTQEYVNEWIASGFVLQVQSTRPNGRASPLTRLLVNSFTHFHLKSLFVFIFAFFSFTNLFSQTGETDAVQLDSIREENTEGNVIQPRIFKNELKINVLSLLILQMFEANYEYNLTKDVGIGAYVQLSSKVQGITAYYRKYPYNNDNQADGFFLGLSPSFSNIDKHAVVGIGTMLGYKNSIDKRFAFEIAGLFSILPPDLLENKYVEPYYLGIAISLGIRL